MGKIFRILEEYLVGIYNKGISGLVRVLIRNVLFTAKVSRKIGRYQLLSITSAAGINSVKCLPINESNHDKMFTRERRS